MMHYRRVGTTNIQLSVIGFGTCQLQMVPKRQAVETLKKGFSLGVNWVHTSPDYGGVEPWIAEAIEESERDIMVLTQGPGEMTLFEAFFEHTCNVFKKKRLAMYGINCINDIEYMGQNVWDSGGMVEFLLKKKDEGRLGGIFCTTHGPADYISKLITSKVFDAIMIAYNPLGFHQLTYYPDPIGREYECIEENRKKIFPIAEKHDVSILVMKPLSGGILCRGKAFPPHKWFPSRDDEISAATILKLILGERSVCAVAPGTASIEEAEENALAGHEPLEIVDSKKEAMDKAVHEMKSSLCSRCGECESTCSRSLPISSIFREAYIWNYRNETFMASDRENYFHLHPNETLVCVTCSEKTCTCPQGINIPVSLDQIHRQMLLLRERGQHPGSPEQFLSKTIKGFHKVLVLSSEVPQKLNKGEIGVCRFMVENVGDFIWRSPYTPNDEKLSGIGVCLDNRLIQKVPLRQNIVPGLRSHIVFEIQPKIKSGDYLMRFYLMSLDRKRIDGNATCFFTGTLKVENHEKETIDFSLDVYTERIFHLFRHSFLRIRKGLIKIMMYLSFRARQVFGLLHHFPGSQLLKRLRKQKDPNKSPRSYGVRYVSHTIPEHLKAGETYGVRLTMENTGTMVWKSNPPEDNPVDLFVLIDNNIFSILKIPRPEVLPGEQVSIHFALRAPIQSGNCELRVELVQQNITWFSNQGVKPFCFNLNVQEGKISQSVQLLNQAIRINPWYYLPTQGIQQSKDRGHFPLFVSRAKGCRVWDPEGREYIDYTMGWGSTILGYADDRIQNAIKDMLHTAPLSPFPHPVEMEVSQMLVEDFPCAEMVVFGKNGSDICTVAARLSRLITGRKVILSCGFHGWQDFCLEHFSHADSGIPDRSEIFIHKFKFNDKDDFFRLYNQHRNDLAAVMIEPSGPWGGDDIGHEPDVDENFLKSVAQATKKAGALLIFDEIITCYRYPQGSVQKAKGVIPDLACLGKALASGMPLSALIGPAHIFYNGFFKTHYCPTFKGEIYSLAAARAAIQIYREEPVAQHIWDYGLRLQKSINSICNQIGLDAECKGPPFRFALVFNEKKPERFRLKRTLYMQELLKEGVVTLTGVMLPSYAHDDAVLDRTVSSVGKALDIVASAERKNNFDQFLEIPLL